MLKRIAAATIVAAAMVGVPASAQAYTVHRKPMPCAYLHGPVYCKGFVQHTRVYDPTRLEAVYGTPIG